MRDSAGCGTAPARRTRLELQLRRETPSVEAYNSLRRSVGWQPIAPLVAEASLAGSLYCVTLWDGAELVGMARVVGDGALYFHLHDVLVASERQGRGLGDRLVRAALAYFEETAGSGAMLGLMSAGGKDGFYERYGFIRRPNGTMGSGMVLYRAG
ncbi:GNAT family N-acetyltransferase [Paradevosia shaoguanensis]|uniref:GNAT family N-acetyltransferase n=1 Tax=Paradevosia shaoguanensis TaxID=1335043 RepID=A0AA41QQ59_9HYPH|nr:GNAT family N-acetyltransferase [Paradevosia shaoguanensis]MCI0128764.1 GNAT family N-acetyltransferase [Paradevosia shaoguanensis]